MNLGQIWAEAGRLLNDPSNQRWSTDILTTRANLAQTEIQGYTNAVKTTETLTANAASISLDSNTLNVLRVNLTDSGGNVKPLQGITIEELSFRYPDFQQWTSGQPSLFSYDATTQKIALYPPPDVPNQVTNGLFVIESRKPADMVNSTDLPFDSNNQMIPYHLSIVYWVVAECWMDNGDPESLSKSKFYKTGSMLNPGQYEMQLGRIMAEFDTEEAIPSSILWQPTGGRVGFWAWPSKSNPLPFNW